MTRALLLLAAAALAACGPVNRSVESVKTPELRSTLLAYDVRFDGGAGLSPRDRAALAEYLGSIRVGYGDRVAVDDPVAAGSPARRAAIAGVLARFGLFLDDGSPVTAGSLPAGTVRVVVTRSRLDVPACPDWRRASNPEFSASAMSDFGCATRGNLAAMIADPNDLTAGRTYAGTDAITATKPIRTLRDRIAKPPESLESLTKTTSGSGK